MDCPKCKGSALRRGKMKGSTVELDRCATCAGLWFDSGELSQVLGGSAAVKVQIPAHAKETGLRCPRCTTALAWFCVPGSTTVVDGCRSCGGLWLDAGEGKALRAALELPQMTCPKCQTRQPKAESCVRCGIVIARYHGGNELQQDGAVGSRPRPARGAAQGGVKQRLLDFIDGALNSLTGR